MSTIKIKKVETRKDLERFIDFHYDLYKDNEYDVPTLFSDDLNTLSKDKNAAFEFSEAEYFMAFDGRGRMVGRVAAIINHRANKRWGRKCVRFGWIDFIDDINVSKALFDAVEKYGKSKGMEEMIGPLGFTDLDPEGMLTMGFDQLGTMATIYNYPYYPEHMEKLGDFEKDNDYVEFKLMVPDKVPEKYTKIAEMIQKRYDLHIRKLTKKDVFEGGYGKKMFELINTCFKDLYGYSELSERQIDQYIKMYFPPGRPQPHHRSRGPQRRQQARGRGHHHPVAVEGAAEVPPRKALALRMVARAEGSEGAQDRGRRPAAARSAARIPHEGCQRPYVLRPHPALSGLRIQMGREPG